jgi:guanosine-3',5'-bis(diphosphate) 3'-pyrophosphohydrolase
MVSAATSVTPQFLISDLCNLLETYLKKGQVKEAYRAYLLGAHAHEGQRRASGEPYIYHPVEVARILAEMRLDGKSIIAALLHDVIEDTEVDKEELTREFGREVADLVDGVSKLTQIEFESRAEAQAENFRKMLLAMTQDIRVILVKLADRLHNMRTLGALRSEKRRTIARETLEIYAPIANRLGINHMRIELEDLGFAAMCPLRCRVLANEVRKARGHRKEIIKQIETAIKRRLRQEGLQGQVLGREKHLYSLYKKMRDKHLSFSDVLDVYAFRIIVDRADTCYRALGAIHNLYKPVPGKFKDYIAIPKANGYQSLHTVLFGPYAVPVEVQIRTEEMHEIAEAGIAAHWAYKTEGARANAAHQRARAWMRELLEMQRSAGNSMEFIEHVKVDLFPDEVYVFTPRGEIMELPRGATAVDFAYAVHTDVGNTCVAAKIDRRYAPLSTKLVSGETVEIITAPWGRPNPNWLNFVVTGKARSNIRNFLKNLQHGEAVELGARLLKNALANESLLLDEVPQERMDALLKDLSLNSLDALLADIGLGNRIAPLVARRLAPASDDERGGWEAAQRPSAAQLAIRGTEGMVVNFAKCCRPIPGDPIHGVVTAGRGIVIHTQTCKNVAEHLKQPEKLIDVEWEKEVEGEFPVEIRVQVANQRGVLATVAAAISDTGANIENVSIEDRDGLYNALTFVIDVADRQHLARVMRRIRVIRLVSKIYRTKS